MKTQLPRFTLFASFMALVLIAMTGMISTLTAASRELAAPTDVVELISNGDFSTGLDPWWTTPSINSNTASGELEAVITSGGSNPWDAIVGQHGIPVQAGELYTLTFDARASTAVTLTVILQEDGGSFTQYFATAVPLTTSSQTFSYSFTPAESNPVATFQYQMGGLGEFTFFLDNVSLMGPEPVVPPPPPWVKCCKMGISAMASPRGGQVRPSPPTRPQVNWKRSLPTVGATLGMPSLASTMCPSTWMHPTP